LRNALAGDVLAISSGDYRCVQFKFLKLMALLKLWKEIFQNLVLHKFVVLFNEIRLEINIDKSCRFYEHIMAMR